MFVIGWVIYPFNVLVCVGEKQPNIIRRIERTGYKLNEEEKEKLWMSGTGRTVMLEGGQTVMRIDKVDHAIIAHEVFHAVEFLMERIRIKLTYENDEAYAYAIQYLTNEISKQL